MGNAGGGSCCGGRLIFDGGGERCGAGMVTTNRSDSVAILRKTLEKESKSGDMDPVTPGATLRRISVSISGCRGGQGDQMKLGL